MYCFLFYLMVYSLPWSLLVLIHNFFLIWPARAPSSLLSESWDLFPPFSGHFLFWLKILRALLVLFLLANTLLFLLWKVGFRDRDLGIGMITTPRPSGDRGGQCVLVCTHTHAHLYLSVSWNPGTDAPSSNQHYRVHSSFLLHICSSTHWQWLIWIPYH